MSTFRYLEDLAVGERVTTAPREVTKADALAFARRFDPQPMHIDPDAAAKGPFGGLIASGWHTAAMVMRLMADSKLLGDAPQLGLGVDEMRWPVPVRPGDRIHIEMEIVEITPSRSKPDFGIVRLNVTARNQKDQVVLIMKPNLWVPRRPAS